MATYAISTSLQQVQSAQHRKFFRLRPSNFPTICIAQFTQLLDCYPHLFNLLVYTPSNNLLKKLAIKQSTYWQQHYQFTIPSKAPIPGLGRMSIENIFINTVVPLLVAYGKAQDEQAYIDKAIAIFKAYRQNIMLLPVIGKN